MRMDHRSFKVFHMFYDETMKIDAIIRHFRNRVSPGWVRQRLGFARRALTRLVRESFEVAETPEDFYYDLREENWMADLIDHTGKDQRPAWQRFKTLRAVRAARKGECRRYNMISVELGKRLWVYSPPKTP